MVRRSQIVGCGSYLPSRIVTNDDLRERIETSDEWIRQRTGIGQRHLAAVGLEKEELTMLAEASVF